MGWPRHPRHHDARRTHRPGLLAVHALGACGVGSLVAVFNALGFRLTSTPFDVTVGSLSLVYLVHVLGMARSTVSGRLADRLGRRSILPAGLPSP